MTQPWFPTVSGGSARPLVPRPRSTALAGLICLGLFGAPGGLGCGEDLSTVNQSARVTSVGPVIPHDWGVYVQYTLRDAEADDQSVTVQICPTDEADAEDCPVPVQGAGGDGRSSLPTLPAGTDVPHRFSWNAGCGLVDADSCVQSELSTEYVARIRIDAPDDTEDAEPGFVTSEPFTLEDIGLQEIPECDPSAGSIPEPCQ